MKKLLLLLVPVLMLACSKDYTEDINTINGRLDKLEQESIPSVNEQLKLLETAIATLKDVDKDLGQLIDDLEKTSGTHTTEINSLKEQDKALDTRVKALESAKDSLEDDVKSLEDKATETLSQLQETNNSLSALSTTVSTLGTNLGNLDKKIDEAVTSLDNKIKSAVEQLNSKIADLESRLKAVEDKVSELLARIQSVSYIPEYTDGKVLVERMGQSSSGSFSFRISPKDCVPALANVWGSALSCEAVYTKTRAVSLTKLTVTEFEGDAENGIITVKFSGEGLSEEFFAGTQEASVALVISDGNNSVVSEYIPMGIVTLELVISLEEKSRTSLGEKIDGMYHLYWSEGDTILCNGMVSSSTRIIEENRALARFIFPKWSEAPYHIVYPAPPTDVVAQKEGCYPVIFQAKQHYKENSFDDGACPMYAFAYDTTPIVRHMAGVVRFEINGDATLSHMVLTTETGYISGVFDLNCETGELFAQEGNVSNQVEVSFGDGLKLSSEKKTSIFFTLPAGSYGAISVSLFDQNGGNRTLSFTTNNNKPIAAGSVREFAGFTYTPNNNQ